MPATFNESAAARTIHRMDADVKERIMEGIEEKKEVITPQNVLRKFKKIERGNKIEAQIEEIETRLIQ